jgi:hypothetical protein
MIIRGFDSQVNYMVQKPAQLTLPFVLSLILLVLRVLSYQYVEISFLVTLLSIIMVIIMVIVKKEEYILLICMSLLEFDAEISPHNIIPSLLAVGLIAKGIRKFNLQKPFLIRKHFLWVIMLILYWVIIGYLRTDNYYYEINYMLYYISDAKITLVVLFSYYLFRDIHISKYTIIIRTLAFSYIFFTLYGYVFELPSIKLYSRDYIGYSSQLSFLITSVLLLAIDGKRYIDYAIIFSILILMLVTNNVGSQNIILIILCFLIFYRKNIKNLFISLIVIGGGIFIIIAVFDEGLYTTRSLSKLENITSLYGNENLYEVSHSSLVRIIEFVNIVEKYTSIYPMLGLGFGSSFTESLITFPSLGIFDYSSDQLNARIFYLPHNVNYGLLKYGIFYIMAVTVAIRKSKFIGRSQERAIILAIILFSAFNIGYTYYPSILTGIAWSYFVRRKTVGGKG